MSAPVKVTDDSAEERWARAAQLAEGVEDDQLRRRRSRFLWFLIGLLAVGFVGGLVAGLLLPKATSVQADDAELPARFFVGVAVAGCGFVVVTAGLIWAKVTGRFITRWRAVWSPLNRKERASFLKQIKLKEPVDEQHLPILIAGAVQGRRSTLGVAPLYGGIVLLLTGSLILGTGATFGFWIYLVCIGLYVALAVVLIVAYRQIGRFLERYRP